MSGVEIAGLVLGSIPLLISGLEHYAEGVSTIKVIFNYKSEFTSLSRRLRVEQDVFRNTMELLLHDCVSDRLLSQLLDDVAGKSWSDPAVEQALQEKLRTSYSVYLETVECLYRSLAEFKQRLKLGEDGKGPFNDPKSFRDAYSRFRFGLKKSAYMDLVLEITRDNGALAKLTQQSAELRPTRMSRKRRPDFETIRGHASSMFTMLQKGLRGTCKASHRASLNMKPTEETTQSDDWSFREPDPVSFRVVLNHVPPIQTQTASYWMVDEAEVRLLDSVRANMAQAPSSLQPMAGKEKKVGWLQDPKTQVATTRAPNVQKQRNLEEIIDLCASIQRYRAMQCGICLGYLQDGPNAKRHGLYWPVKRFIDRSSFDSLSLGTILEQQVRQQALALSVADSRRLALALAFGMLRLYDTPWLAKRWGRDDITLFKQNDNIPAEHPFVSTDLQNSGKLQISGQGNSSQVL